MEIQSSAPILSPRTRCATVECWVQTMIPRLGIVSATRSRKSHARGPSRARSITRQLIRMAISSSGGTGDASVRKCQLRLCMRLESTRTKPLSESITARRIGPGWELKVGCGSSGASRASAVMLSSLIRASV